MAKYHLRDAHTCIDRDKMDSSRCQQIKCTHFDFPFAQLAALQCLQAVERVAQQLPRIMPMLLLLYLGAST